MLWLALGAFTLFLFLGGLRAFEKASIATIRSLLVWIAALGGLTLALLLVLSGRGGIAIGALTLFGPLVWSRWHAVRHATANASRNGSRQPPPRSPAGPMTREEAYQVLGLRPGAAATEIRAAHRRLMRAAHPDSGGSDWLAARINQARDVLLGGKS